MPKGPLRTVFFVCNNDFLCFDTSAKAYHHDAVRKYHQFPFFKNVVDKSYLADPST